MRVYALTALGHQAARSTRLEDKPSTRILYFLDKRGGAPVEQISEFCGLGNGEAMATLRKMQAGRAPLVYEVGRERGMEIEE